jgi:hypothetical protein
MSNEAQIIQAIKDLESALKKQLNRTLASEALLEAWVSRTDPRALAGLGEAYDAALDRLAAGLEPRLQLPQLWAHWSALIAELQKSHAASPPQPLRSDDSL